MKKKKETAKQVASRDITEDCRRRKEGQNCLQYEAGICEWAGVEGHRDFRMFNGGHNKKK